MITVYFETDVVAASVRFHADDYDICSEGRLHILKNGAEIATFKADIWRYVDITDYEVPVEEKEKRPLTNSQRLYTDLPMIVGQ